MCVSQKDSLRILLHQQASSLLSLPWISYIVNQLPRYVCWYQSSHLLHVYVEGGDLEDLSVHTMGRNVVQCAYNFLLEVSSSYRIT